MKQDASRLEWVQCETCRQWRKLPLHIAAASLPETWVCSMTTWNPARASCSAPADEDDDKYAPSSGQGKPGGGHRNLPSGINLYQFAAPGIKPSARALSNYRDLIVAHYARGLYRTWDPAFTQSCEDKYAAYPEYTSPAKCTDLAHQSISLYRRLHGPPPIKVPPKVAKPWRPSAS